MREHKIPNWKKKCKIYTNMLEKRKPKKNCGRKTNVKRVAKNAKKQNSGAPFISNENDELQSVEEEGKIFLI